MPTQVYISHAEGDESLCALLLGVLDVWGVDYWFDRQPGGARQLSTRAQKALNESTVLLRICTRAANRSYSMSLEAGAILSLQAEDHRMGQDGRRSLVNVILDPAYRREPFDSTAPILDATDPAKFGWVNALRGALLLPELQDAEAAAVARRVIARPRGISRRRVLALGATGAVVAAAGTSAGVLLLTHNRGGTASVTSVPQATPPSTDPKLVWFAQVVQPDTQSSSEEGVGVAPVLADGFIFTGALDGSLYAVDAHTGTVRWQKVPGDGIYAAPVFENGTIYLCAHGPNGVLAIDGTTGRQLWQAPAKVSTFSDVAYANEHLYVSGVGDFVGFVFVVDPSDGKQMFEVHPNDVSIQSIPSSRIAIADGIAYIGDFNGFLYALDLNKSSGAERWKADVGAAAANRLKVAPFTVSGKPAVAGGMVFAGSADQSIYALDKVTGEQRWNFATTGQIVRSSPAVEGDVLYIGSDDMKLYALDARTGAARWVFTTAGKVRSSPVVANGIVYVGSGDAYVYAVDAETGTLVRKYATADAVIAPPVIGDNVLYAADFAGYLYAFNIS